MGKEEHQEEEVMKKVYYSYSDMHNMYQEVIRGMSSAQYKPDVVVGISRGGLDLAMKISHWYDIPMHCLEWQTRDGAVRDMHRLTQILEQQSGHNVLIVDDILDSGTTMHEIAEVVNQRASRQWVDFAVAIENTDADFEISWSGSTLSRMDNDSWIVFPWENWWEQK